MKIESLIARIVGLSRIGSLIQSKLKRWTAWSAVTARELRQAKKDLAQVVPELLRTQGLLRRADEECVRLQKFCDWMMEKGFQFEGSGKYYPDTHLHKLRVDYNRTDRHSIPSRATSRSAEGWLSDSTMRTGLLKS